MTNPSPPSPDYLLSESRIAEQAADTYRELNSRLAFCSGATFARTFYEKEIPRWISVDERLPEEGEAVIVTFNNEVSCIDWLPGVDDLSAVTHWLPLESIPLPVMPLPEPPEEKPNKP